jgi:broad specificity phosphatase PhoE
VLIIVRHGQTAPNAEGVLLGRADPPLTELGRRQAAALAAALGRPDRLVSSPLQRARDTAAAFGQPVQIDERWIELDYGELDGVASEAVSEQVWDRWRSDPGFAPEGGESLLTLGERVRAACRDLAEEAAVADIVVVSHVSPIKAAVAWALGTGDEVAWRLYVYDASVTRIRTGPAGAVLVGFNEVHPPADRPARSGGG